MIHDMYLFFVANQLIILYHIFSTPSWCANSSRSGYSPCDHNMIARVANGNNYDLAYRSSLATHDIIMKYCTQQTTNYA